MDRIMLSPGKMNMSLNSDIWELRRSMKLGERKIYLYGEIFSLDSADSVCADASTTSLLAEYVLEINREDEGIGIEERDPIMLYINSPGGDVTEGLTLMSAIEISQTPVYTVNMGQWSSMAFLIGIAGHKRFSLPYSSFLMHDGSIFAFGSSNKVRDQVEFESRIEREIVKPHVLKHSNGKMSEEEYDKVNSKEFYMLPGDALEYGFIDEIVNDIKIIY